MDRPIESEPGATPPDALLLIASHCPHCESVLNTLARLVKEGALGRLSVVNLSASPDAPEACGIRSVPWTRIGLFELSGALTTSELKDWIAVAREGGGWGRYFAYLIEEGQLDTLVGRVRTNPAAVGELLRLFADPDTPLSVRIGISAAMEHLSDSDLLRRSLQQILSLTQSPSAQVRADACYFVGLAGDPAASESVRRLLEDEDPEVREVAGEVLSLLGDSP